MLFQNLSELPEGEIDWSCDPFAEILEPAPFQPKESPLILGAHVKNVTAMCRYSPMFREIKEKMEDKKRKEEDEHRKDHTCTKCQFASNLTNEFLHRGWIRHSLKHTPIDQFHCHMCQFRCRWEDEIREHLRNAHEYCDSRLPLDVTNFNYTKDERKKIVSYARECFPDVALIAPDVKNLDFLKKNAPAARKSNKFEICQECKEEIAGNHRTIYENKENHIAEAHTKDHFWKCVKCLQYSSHSLSDVTEHLLDEHAVKTPRLHGDYKRIATHKQRKDMSEFLIKCFPGTKIPGVIANSKFAE